MNAIRSPGQYFFRCGVLLLCCAALNTKAADSADPQQVARGHYVALAADCSGCHTAPGGKPFAGGKVLKTPFGWIYGSNITPDPKTGIGTWSKADFTKALRQGVRKDGALIYPAMPYNSYTKITDDDIDALWAYMQSLSPVAHRVHENTFKFPLNIRQGLGVWQALYFDPGRYQPDAAHDQEWNRGAYLVDALGHCRACHTPRNIMQAPETAHALTGAQIEGWYAPNIGNDPLSGISAWSVGELAAFLKSGKTPDNEKAFGPMKEVIHDSLSHLEDADLKAMAVYLKQLPSGAQPRSTLTAASNASLAAGKAVYGQYCSSCHQDDGQGVNKTVPALAGNTAVAAREPYNVIMSVLEGYKPQGLWGVMPSFAGTLSDDQIADVANYVRSAWGNHGAPAATAWTVHNWRPSAVTPKHDVHAAVICPDLSDDLLQPALSVKPAMLRKALDDRAGMSSVVAGYTAARPHSSPAQVIEALSTAYCRAVVSDGHASARDQARIADFAQQAAVALAQAR